MCIYRGWTGWSPEVFSNPYDSVILRYIYLEYNYKSSINYIYIIYLTIKVRDKGSLKLDRPPGQLPNLHPCPQDSLASRLFFRYIATPLFWVLLLNEILRIVVLIDPFSYPLTWVQMWPWLLAPPCEDAHQHIKLWTRLLPMQLL